MLEVDRQTGKLTYMERVKLDDEGWSETSHLQPLIYQNPAEFFLKECGERLLVLAQEFNPSTRFDAENRRIDLLAIDSSGKTVIVELKRGHNKRQLLQAVTYAALISNAVEWQRVEQLMESKREALDSFLSESDFDSEQKLNQEQRIILIAEAYDPEIIETAKWLAEHSIEIACYEVSLAKSSAGSEYLSCKQVFPPKELAENMRQQAAIKAQQAASKKFTTLRERLAIGTIAPVKSFVDKCLEDSHRLNTREWGLVWPLTGKSRYRLSVRPEYALVTQLGRFHGDTEIWSKLFRAILVKRKYLKFKLANEVDIMYFLNFIQKSLPDTAWSSITEDATEDEDAE